METAIARADAPLTNPGEIAAAALAPDAREKVFVNGDLSKLSPADRLAYYGAYCQALGLNPLTRPFQYLTLSGKMVLYATRDCADQLRKIHGVSVRITAREIVDGLYVVTARASTPDGREDEASGAVALGNASGEARANILMKAETKAKRRVTLSICGLGVNDETEVETIPGASTVPIESAHAATPSQSGATRSAKPIPAEAAWFLEIGGTAEHMARINAVAKENGITGRYCLGWAKEQGLVEPDDITQSIEDNWSKAEDADEDYEAAEAE